MSDVGIFICPVCEAVIEGDNPCPNGPHGDERSMVMFAVCKAAGWAYCAEHDRPLHNGSDLCQRLHDEPTWEHVYYCSWPDGECLGSPCEQARRVEFSGRPTGGDQ